MHNNDDTVNIDTCGNLLLLIYNGEEDSCNGELQFEKTRQTHAGMYGTICSAMNEQLGAS